MAITCCEHLLDIEVKIRESRNVQFEELPSAFVATTVVVPELVWDLTDGAAGGGVLLLVAGAVLLATSLGSRWLWRIR